MLVIFNLQISWGMYLLTSHIILLVLIYINYSYSIFWCHALLSFPFFFLFFFGMYSRCLEHAKESLRRRNGQEKIWGQLWHKFKMENQSIVWLKNIKYNTPRSNLCVRLKVNKASNPEMGKPKRAGKWFS